MRLAWIGIATIVPLTLMGFACAPSGGAVCCSNNVCYDQCYGSSAGSGTEDFDANDGPVAEPMLVRVQTGKTLTAAPGGGVGVFVEYATGGHWTIWWTCDTKKTGSTCNFEINATTKDGDITSIAGTDGTTLTPPDAGDFDGAPFDAGSPAFPISGTTTNQVQGLTFDAKPGAIVEVTATLDGSNDGDIFYWVDGDKVKDGYKGQLTDPLDFQPTAP
jgi:hypothetical protein